MANRIYSAKDCRTMLKYAPLWRTRIPEEELKLTAKKTAEVIFLVFSHHTQLEGSWESRLVHEQEVTAAGGGLAARESGTRQAPNSWEKKC